MLYTMLYAMIKSMVGEEWLSRAWTCVALTANDKNIKKFINEGKLACNYVIIG